MNNVTERLDMLHNRIATHYLWWAREAPGVTPAEEGVLKDLWDEVDRLTPLERVS